MQKVLAYFGISMILSFVFAITFVIVMTLTLPKTDLMYGQMPFQDPLVLPIMSMFAGWPLFAILGRRSSPVPVAKTAGIATLVFIVVATPIDARVGWFASYIVCLAALVYRFVRDAGRNGQQTHPGDRVHPPAKRPSVPPT